MSVCGLDLRVLRHRGDYFSACAGDLPIQSTGTVLWECGVLLADYLGYARWIHSTGTLAAVAEGCAETIGKGDATGREGTTENDIDKGSEEASIKEVSPHPWWMTHPPAPVVPSRFWGPPQRPRVLELGGGCGIVTAVLASLGANVVCTDGDPNAIRVAQRNCSDAQGRYGKGAPRAMGVWGSTDFRELRWGDDKVARGLVKEFGPFRFIVGSDLLYGDDSDPEPLLDTLAAIIDEQKGAESEVVLALKSRCTNETERLCSLARRRDIWGIRLAERNDLLDEYAEVTYQSSEGEAETPAYNIIHLTPLSDSKLERSPKRRRE